MAVDVTETVEDIARELRLEHPEATIRTSLPGSVTARGHETFELALAELVENAAVHNDRAAPTVDVAVTERSDTVEIRVADGEIDIAENDSRGTVVTVRLSMAGA